MLYYSLIKPERTYANAITAGAGFLMASGVARHFDFWLFVATLAGTSMIVASACMINNYIDRSLDAHMARTKKRALVRKEVSATSAVVIALALGLAGFALLAVYVNWLTVLLGAIGVFDYLVLYGISKRKTIYGTIVGSISGATPIAAGYVAVTDRFDTGAILLAAVLVLWQMPHFYAISMYRHDDYKSAHVPVWSVVKGMQNTKWQILLFTAAFVVATLLLTPFGYTGWTYFVVMMVVGFLWLRRGFSGFRATDDVAWGRKMFGFSLLVLMTFSAMVVLGPLLP